MSDTSVVFNVLARDRASRVFDKVRRSALEGSSGIASAFGPALLPVLGAATAGIVGMGTAMVSAGAAVGVFGAVAKSAFSEVKEASDKTDDLREKISLLDEQIKVANETGFGNAGQLEKAKDKAVNELIARYNMMPPALRNVTMAYDGMKSSWQQFVEKNKPATYQVMASGFHALSNAIPLLQPLFDLGAQAAGRFAGWLGRIANGGGLERFVAFLTSQAGPAIDNFATIGRNMGIAIGGAFRDLAPAGDGILTWLAKASEKAANFAQGGGFQRFMDSVRSTGPGVVSTLGNLAAAAMNIARAVSPLAPLSLAVAGALTALIAAVPPGVITALVAAWIAYSIALKGYNAYITIAGLATKAYAAAQWVMNSALLASPITWVVLAIVALIAIVVLIATKTKWFQTIWRVAWGAIKTAASSAWTWIRQKTQQFVTWISAVPGRIRDRWNSIWGSVRSRAADAWSYLRTKATSFYNWIVGLPGKVSSKLRGMFNGLWSGFKSVANKIIGGWNRLSFTIGGGSFMGMTVPSVSFGTPNIPYLAKGGNIMRAGSAIVGERGPELVSLRRGAQVTPLTGGGRGGDVRLIIDIRGGDAQMRRMIQGWIRTDNLLSVRAT